jgi:hypothetical protein
VERVSGAARIIVASSAEIAGQQVRRILDDGDRVAGFVGDFNADRDALDEFVYDVVRPRTLGDES